MDYLTIIEFIAFALTIIGALFISIPKKIGLYIFIIACIFWSYFAIITQHYFLLIQNFILICFDIIGIYNWSKQGIN
jgi:nicotinamide riboside transporter PnuC